MRLKRGDAYAVSLRPEKSTEEKKELKEVKRQDGLISGHAYGFLKTYTDKKGVDLLKLRNPWGDDEWNGAYSKGSKEWTAELKAAVGDEKGDQKGSFWISSKDFFAHFGQITGVRMFDASYKASVTCSFIEQDNKTEQTKSFSIEPETECQVLVVVQQRDARYWSDGRTDEYEVGIGFEVFETEDPADVASDESEKKKILTVAPQNERSVTAMLSVTPDKGYFLVPFVDVPEKLKAKKKQLRVYFRTYAQSTVQLTEMGYLEQEEAEEEEEEEEEEQGEDKEEKEDKAEKEDE
jgi:hypothetical protein